MLPDKTHVFNFYLGLSYLLLHYGNLHSLLLFQTGLPFGIPTASLAHVPIFPMGTSSSSSPLTMPSSTLTTPALLPTSTTPITSTNASPTTSTNQGFSTALPPKLVKKILDLEFVDMAELVPDAWQPPEDENPKCCHQPRRAPKRGPVTDILLWVECFSMMAGILTTKYPERAPDLFAYQKTIVHASRSFSGDHWVTYDLCYRRQAAATKSLRWSIIDFSLYNETFTGRARVLPRCRYCLSEHHRSSDCTFAPDQSPSTPKATPRESTSRPQICLLFNTKNGNQCRFRPCRFLHICSNCQEPHPAATCRYARPPLRKYPHFDNGQPPKL